MFCEAHKFCSHGVEVVFFVACLAAPRMVRPLQNTGASWGTVALALVACAPGIATAEIDAALPKGFSTFFHGSFCPPGWIRVNDGWLLHSRTDGNGAYSHNDRFVVDGELRTHRHAVSGSFHLREALPQHSTRGRYDMCYDASANAWATLTDPSVFGGPFAQLLLCQVADDATDRSWLTVGDRVLGFFDQGSCPSADDWGSAAHTNGRFIVARASPGAPTNNAAAPLGDGGDVSHGHAYEAVFTTVPRGLEVPPGPQGLSRQLAHGTYTASGTTEDAALDLPYKQVATCSRHLPSEQHELTCLPQHALIFTEDAACPDGWDFFGVHANRLLIPTPTNGTSGLKFGSGDLFAGHAHGASVVMASLAACGRSRC